MKRCPYCAEKIQDAAIVCRYCGRELLAQGEPRKQVVQRRLPGNPLVWAMIGCGVPATVLAALFLLAFLSKPQPAVEEPAWTEPPSTLVDTPAPRPPSVAPGPQVKVQDSAECGRRGLTDEECKSLGLHFYLLDAESIGSCAYFEPYPTETHSVRDDDVGGFEIDFEGSVPPRWVIVERGFGASDCRDAVRVSENTHAYDCVEHSAHYTGTVTFSDTGFRNVGSQTYNDGQHDCSWNETYRRQW